MPWGIELSPVTDLPVRKVNLSSIDNLHATVQSDGHRSNDERPIFPLWRTKERTCKFGLLFASGYTCARNGIGRVLLMVTLTGKLLHAVWKQKNSKESFYTKTRIVAKVGRSPDLPVNPGKSFTDWTWPHVRARPFSICAKWSAWRSLEIKWRVQTLMAYEFDDPFAALMSSSARHSAIDFTLRNADSRVWIKV